jgi:hypothetical protein
MDTPRSVPGGTWLPQPLAQGVPRHKAAGHQFVSEAARGKLWNDEALIQPSSPLATSGVNEDSIKIFATALKMAELQEHKQPHAAHRL